MTFVADCENDFSTIATEIIKQCEKKRIFLLFGDLAAGKTTLVKYILKSLQIDAVASSPTFSIMNEYGDTIKVFHYDIYQDGSEKFIHSSLWQNLLEDGYHFIEWPDEKIVKLLSSLGMDFVRIDIEKQENKRIVTLHE